jgi:hypothetical protein
MLHKPADTGLYPDLSIRLLRETIRAGGGLSKI